MSISLDEARTYQYQQCVNAWIKGSLIDESSLDQITEVILIIFGSRYWEKLFDKDGGEKFFSHVSKYIPKKILVSICENLIVNKALGNMICRGELDLGNRSFSLNKRESSKNSDEDYNTYKKWYEKQGASRKILLDNQISERLLYSLPSPQLCFLLGGSRQLLENIHLQKMVQKPRFEIINGLSKLYESLKRKKPSTITPAEQILILEALFKGRIKGSLPPASFNLEKLFPGEITFLTLLHDWASFSDNNKKKVEQLHEQIFPLNLFCSPCKCDDRNKFYLDFPKDLGFQEFVVEVCLKLFANNFKQQWGWVPDIESWSNLLKEEEIREDFMIGFVYYPDLLLRNYPLYEPAKSHPLFQTHKIFLQHLPSAPKRALEGKARASSLLSSGVIFEEAGKKFYSMIQERDTALDYPAPKSLSIKIFLNTYQTFCKFQDIEKNKAYFLFLQLLSKGHVESEITQVLELAQEIMKKAKQQTITSIFFAFFQVEDPSRIGQEILYLLEYSNIQLNEREIAKLIGQYPKFNVPHSLVVLKSVQEELDTLSSLYPNSVWILYKMLIKDNSYAFLSNLNKYEWSADFLIKELFSFVSVVDQLKEYELTKSQYHQLFFFWVEKASITSHPMSGSVAFIKSVREHLNITLGPKDSFMLLKAMPDFAPWNRALAVFEMIKGVILEDTNFTIGPKTYKELERAILLLKTIPEVDPEFEDGFERLSLQLQDYFKFSLFISYQNFLDNFHVKTILRDRVIYSETDFDTTDLQFDHTGRFSEIIPASSIMTAWLAPTNGEFPHFLTCYLKEEEQVSARFLFHRLNWSISTDQYLTRTLSISEKPKGLDCPYIDKEAPPTEFQRALFTCLKLLSKHVLLEANTLEPVTTLSRERFTLPKDDPEDGSPNPNNEYPYHDDILTAFSMLDHISNNLSKALKRRGFSAIDSLEKEWVNWNQEQTAATLDQVVQQFSEKGLSKIIAEYAVEPKTYQLQREVFTFFDRLKKEATKTWRDSVFDRGSKSSSAQVITTESIANETWYDEKKQAHPFKRAVLQTTLTLPLTTKELTLDILYQAHRLISETSDNVFLGKIKRGKLEKLSSLFVNSEGTRQNGSISITSTSSDQGNKVVLRVVFPNKETYKTIPFVYDKAQLTNPEKFSNLFSLQLLLLKTLYHRKPHH